jgi:type IV pilus assembly protein PilW
MKFQRSLLACGSQKSAAGFTVVEFLVASFIGLLVMALAMSSTLSGRSLYREDVVRTRIQQNLRSAIDLITLNARQAGESFESTFPAILISNGSGSNSDELVLRRNLFENEVLNICQDLTAGAVNTEIVTSNDPANLNANCRYTAGWQTFLMTTWRNYRTAQGGTVRAFAFNRSTRAGEFFPYSGEVDSSSQLRVQRSSGSWTNNYTGDGVSAAFYLAEEFRYRLSSGVLQLVVNDDASSALNVVDGITDFQVLAHMEDGTTKTALAATDEWTEVVSLEISVSGSETIGGKTIADTLTTQVFARNILSH